MIVVADTSPLNYLVLLGHIEILAKIYAAVVVPQTVLDELQVVATFLTCRRAWSTSSQVALF
jgi:predicted nucleic acid-binding protein